MDKERSLNKQMQIYNKIKELRAFLQQLIEYGNKRYNYATLYGRAN